MDVVDGIEAEARTIPTDAPESDGTLEWRETTIVLVRVRAGAETGIGYTYADASAAALVESKLAPALAGPRSYGHRRVLAGDARGAAQRRPGGRRCHGPLGR